MQARCKDDRSPGCAPKGEEAGLSPAADLPSSSATISASIMCADCLRLADQIQQLETAGVDMIHVDIMDAHFVPNMPIGLKTLADLYSVTALPLDVHLMVDDNDFFAEQVARYGVSWLSIHVESADHLDRQLARIRELGMKAAAAGWSRRETLSFADAAGR